MAFFNKGNIRPMALKTEAVCSPLGIDNPNPLFSWQLTSEHRAQKQTAYRIIVSSKGLNGDALAGDMWDSGKVVSDKTLQLRYSGKPLLSTERYYWKVMVWDGSDAASEWSDEAWFEMGMLEPDDWRGVWIGGSSLSNPLENAHWIWHPEMADGETSTEKTYSFKKTFEIQKDITLQQVIFDGTAVSRFELFINGNLVRRTNTAWRQDYTSPMRYVDITDLCVSGQNEIFCKVVKEPSEKGGLIGRVQIRYKNEPDKYLYTDDTWLVNEEKAVIAGNYGDEPWGRVKRRGIAPLLRKEFDLSAEIEKARLYVCGLGYCDLHINGRHVDNAVLRTEYSQFNKTVYYNTIDVTEYVKKGANCIGVELGRGYYSFIKDWIGLMPEQDEPKLLLQLKVLLSDGTTKYIASDGTWETTDGPTIDDSIWYGDKYDARLMKHGWNISGYDAHAWANVKKMNAPAGKLKSSLAPPIRIVETLKPVKITKPENNVTTYDFGKVTAGWAKISVNEERGTRIKLTYGEKLLENGRVDIFTESAVFQFWDPPQVDIYVCGGNAQEVWEPKFSYKGYRYVEVEGVDHVIDIEGNVLHNDLETTGTFSCSNELFNSIHGIITPTILNNFHSIPTDTPMYEKRGWTGDAQAISDTVMLNFNAQRFFHKWMVDLVDCQSDLGEIPDTCPGPVYYPPAPEWMSAFVVIPYDMYLYYGDIQLIKNYYHKMKRYAEYEINRMDNWVSSNKHYGDWCSPGNGAPPEGAALSSTMYVYYVLYLVGKISKVLKMEKDLVYFDACMEKIKAVINEKFFDGRENLYKTNVEAGFRQTSTVLPLAFGAVPDELRDKVVSSLAESIISKDKSHLNTGCFGLKFLAPVLTENGHEELAFSIVNQTSYPSWGYWLSQGATTCWEQWETTSRSYDHYFMGSIDSWFYRYIAGIYPISEGYKHFMIKPYICGDLKNAKATLKTVRGNISSEWTLEAGKFNLDIDVPVNTTAEVHIPLNKPDNISESGIVADKSEGVVFEKSIGKYSVYTVGSGKYRFTLAYNN